MVLRGTVYSRSLEMETGLTVITPNDYGQAKVYRVCYCLHGLCGGNQDFSNHTNLSYLAYDKDIIFLCPEVQRSFYMDTAYGMKYFTYVADELPHLAKLTFNISASREDTAVIGCSMGGYGALKLAFSKPETFGAVAAFAPGIIRLKEYLDEIRRTGKTDFPDLYGVLGKDLPYREKDDLAVLAKNYPKHMQKPDVFLYCGKEDWLHDSSIELSSLLKELSFPFIYEEYEGKHDFFAFNEGLKRFIEAWKKS